MQPGAVLRLPPAVEYNPYRGWEQPPTLVSICACPLDYPSWRSWEARDPVGDTRHGSETSVARCRFGSTKRPSPSKTTGWRLRPVRRGQGGSKLPHSKIGRSVSREVTISEGKTTPIAKLPKGWNETIRSAVLRAIALARFARITARGCVAQSETPSGSSRR